MLITCKVWLRSYELKREILDHLSSAIRSYRSERWWVLNGMTLERELGLISSKRTAKKVIRHGTHFDAYYLRQIRYELRRYVK